MNKLSDEHISFGDRLIAILICTLPITSYYKAPVLFSDMNTFIHLLIVAYLSFKLFYNGRKRINISIPAICFFGYFILVTIISLLTKYGNHYASSNKFIAMIIVFVMVFEIKNVFGAWDYLVKVYSFLCVVVIACFVAQLIWFYVFNSFLTIKLPFELNDVYYLKFTYFGRTAATVQFSSLFSEKSHMCQYLVPFLGIQMLNYHQKKTGLWKPILVSIVLFASVSGVGIVMTLVLWCYYFFVILKGNQNGLLKKALLIMLVIIILFFLNKVLIDNVPQYADTVSRLFSSSATRGSKADYRIYRGFDIYKQMPFFNQIFGIGYRQYNSFAQYNGISSIFDNDSSITEYFSAVFQILVYFGFVGFSISLSVIWKLCKVSKNKLTHMLKWIFLLTAVVSSIFLDSTCILYLCLIFASEQLEMQNEMMSSRSSPKT